MSILGLLGSKIISGVRYGSNVWSIPGVLPKTSWICNNIIRPITTTPILLAEPMKRKKRVDPGIQKKRDERKQKKLEKSIRKLAKNARQLKPIEELLVPDIIVDRPKERNRRVPELTTQEVEDRWLLEKQMAKVKMEHSVRESKYMENVIKSQEVALKELRNESEELYVSAIEFDTTYLPFTASGPVDTPPIKDYPVSEGDYIDISRVWAPPI